MTNLATIERKKWLKKSKQRKKLVCEIVEKKEKFSKKCSKDNQRKLAVQSATKRHTESLESFFGGKIIKKEDKKNGKQSPKGY